MVSKPSSARRAFLAKLIAVVVLLLASVPARASADPSCPASPSALPPRQTIVRVDALEHLAYGVVVAESNLVAVPYHVVEVDKVGGVDAVVQDAEGVRHPARLVAIDRLRGLALLRTREPLAEPLVAEPTRAADADACTFVLRADIPEGGLELGQRAWAAKKSGPPMVVADGSPVIDTDGHLIGIFSQGAFDKGSLIPNASIDDVVGSLDRTDTEHAAARRSFIGYGGISVAQVELSPAGSAWLGERGSAAMRYRDLLEGRLDLAVTLLAGKKLVGRPCSEPPCSDGLRATATPSLGLHLRLGSFGHEYARPIAITPSIGWAFVAQYVQATDQTTAFDVKSPSFFHTFAPGVSVSVSSFEVSARMRMPRDDVRSPAYDLSVGAVF